MSKAREAATAVALSGRICVIGGTDRTTSLDTVEEYDPSTDTWTSKSAMNVPRHYATGVTLGDMAYVIGGLTLTSSPQSPPAVTIVETYDPTKEE